MNPDHFTLVQRILPALVALIIVIATVELIRRRRLREEYSLLWLFASVVLAVFAIYPRLLWHISEWLGIYYLTTMVLGSFFFLLLLTLRIGMSISRLTDNARQTAQRVALLERKIEQLTGEAIDTTDEEPDAS